MSRTTVAALLATAGCALAMPGARAASGGIDSFWASSTQVQVGDTVDFSVSVSLATTGWAYGGSNPTEPPPQEGYQEWSVNWYYWEYETLRDVWLQVGANGFADSPAIGPGSNYANTWSFAVTFDTPGTYSFDVSGGWRSDIESGYSNEGATRSCYYTDPDNPGDLWCDSWTWQYSDGYDWYSTEGSLRGGSISIEVLAAAVPEPSRAALMFAGAALLALRRRCAESGTARGSRPR